MISFIPDRAPRRIGSFGRRRAGFTLVEMLVVIGIILTLMAIILPAASRAYKVATRNRMQQDIQTVSLALEAYYGDFQAYPQVVTPTQGSSTLYLALFGPTGNGFRLPGRTAGKIWGPYLTADKIRTDGVSVMDRYFHPILYYPAHHGPGIDITQNGGFDGPNGTGLFNPNDNTSYIDPVTSAAAMPVAQFQVLMGDFNQDGIITPGLVSVTVNGKSISMTEQPAFTGDFILWSAGPNEHYGPDINGTQPVSSSNRCDDVANFWVKEY